MWYYGLLCSIYCSHDIWESRCQEQVNFDSVCLLWETSVLFLSPCRCLKYPRQHKSKRDISALCATVCWKDPEARRWRVSKSLAKTGMSWFLPPILNQTRAAWLGNMHLSSTSSLIWKTVNETFTSLPTWGTPFYCKNLPFNGLPQFKFFFFFF